MSIKDFHIVFIVCSIVLCVFFGIWALNNYGQPTTPGLRLTATGSFTIAIALTVYAIIFLKKMKSQIKS